MCSPNSYFHRHNINIPSAENRDSINITKYISFFSPVSVEIMNETKQKPKRPTPTYMKTKGSLDQEEVKTGSE